MRAHHVLFTALASISICASAFAFACSSSDDSPATTPPTTDDGGANEAATPAGETFNVYVGNGADIGNGAPPPPFANATVIFQKPGGEIVEVTSDANGIASVPGIDWSLGKAGFTLYAEGTQVESLVELDKAYTAHAKTETPDVPNAPPHDLVWMLFPIAKFPTLSGNFTHAQGSGFAISPTVAGTSAQGGASAGSGKYSLTAAKDKPFSLLTLETSPVTPSTTSARGRENEIKRWGKIDRPAMTGDSTFDLDFDTATPLTPIKGLKGKVMIPGGKDGPLGGTSSAIVFTSTAESLGAVITGITSKLDISPDGASFDYVLDHVTLENTKTQATYVIQLTDGTASLGTEFDFPADGFVMDGLPMPAVVVETSRSPFKEPFAIDGLDPAVAARVICMDPLNVVKWTIDAPPGTKTFAPPPMTSAAKKQIGALSLGRVYGLGAFKAERLLFTRVSISRSFLVK